MSGSTAPTDVRVLVVSVADLVAALELNNTTGRTAVLRVTPPFSGRMRARLHIESGAEYGDGPRPIHVEPASLLSEDAPSCPRPATTEDELRADPTTTYTVDRHRERHSAAVDAWRDAVVAAVAERATIRTPAGPHEVAVTTLGDLSTLDEPSPPNGPRRNQNDE